MMPIIYHIKRLSLTEWLAPQVCVVSASLVQLSFVNDNPGLTRNLHNALCFFNPLYPLMGCLNCITKVGAQLRQTVLFNGFSACRFVFKPALSFILDNVMWTSCS